MINCFSMSHVLTKDTKPEIYLFFASLVLLAVFFSAVTIATNGDNTNSLNCTIQEGQFCGDGMTEVFSLFDYNNTHVGAPNYFDNYVLCCDQDYHSGGLLVSSIVDNSTDSDIGKELSKRSILSLYQENNTHVEDRDLGEYQKESYMFPYTDCEVVEGGCSPEEECILQMYDMTDSHIEGCGGDYNYSLCCNVPDPDENLEVCEWMDGFEYPDGFDEIYNYRWNYTDVEYEDETSNPNCCGDVWNVEYRQVERETIRKGERGVFQTGVTRNSSDWACCNGTIFEEEFYEGCTFESACYDHCDFEDVMNDGYDETCYDGEWKLGGEMYQIHVDGSVIDWETAEIVDGANITTQLVNHRGEVLDSATAVVDMDEDEEGRFVTNLQHPLTEGNIYTIVIISEWNEERSSMEKDFVFHGGHGEHIEQCLE